MKPPMPEATARWIFETVFENYYWHDWPNVPANEHNEQCGPVLNWPPIPPTICFCDRRMGSLIGTRRIRDTRSRGFPWRWYPVYLAHARDRYRLAGRALQEQNNTTHTAPEPAPATIQPVIGDPTGQQLGLFEADS